MTPASRSVSSRFPPTSSPYSPGFPPPCLPPLLRSLIITSSVRFTVSVFRAVPYAGFFLLREHMGMQRGNNNYVWVCDRLATVTEWYTYCHKRHHVCELWAFKISSVNQSSMAAGRDNLMLAWQSGTQLCRIR